MNINNKIALANYAQAKVTNEEDVKLCFLWNVLCQYALNEDDVKESLRASIRKLIENNFEAFDKDIDYENELIDVFYELPVFSNLTIEEDKDIYYYQDFNTNLSFRKDDDRLLSIKNFQSILEDSDLVAFYMSIFKVYDFVKNNEDDNYTDRQLRLIKGSNYLLSAALKNIFD